MSTFSSSTFFNFNPLSPWGNKNFYPMVQTTRGNWVCKSWTLWVQVMGWHIVPFPFGVSPHGFSMGPTYMGTPIGISDPHFTSKMNKMRVRYGILTFCCYFSFLTSDVLVRSKHSFSWKYRYFYDNNIGCF